MHNITFDFLGQHRHGSAFHEYLRLRKSFFVDALGWDIPHNDDVEMDQYDNPCAHYSLVLRRGKVVGGAARCRRPRPGVGTPTCCGTRCAAASIRFRPR